MSFLKGKISYASLGKSKTPKHVETSALSGKENNCIYQSVLNGMNGTQKEYISDLIKIKRKKEERLAQQRSYIQTPHQQSSKIVKQPLLRMNSPKMKHVQSLDEMQFLQEKSDCKYKSNNTSVVTINKKDDPSAFIGSLDGYIHKLESTQTSKVRIDEYSKDYEKKYKHLAEVYMQQINVSKQKQEKLMSYIKKLKRYVRELQQKVVQSQNQSRQFGILWKRREQQIGILMGIQQQIQQHVYSGSMSLQKLQEDSQGLQLESFDDDEDSPEHNIRNTIKYNPQQRRRKSRHTVNYY